MTITISRDMLVDMMIREYGFLRLRYAMRRQELEEEEKRMEALAIKLAALKAALKKED